jgi:hypothetical protein
MTLPSKLLEIEKKTEGRRLFVTQKQELATDCVLLLKMLRLAIEQRDRYAAGMGYESDDAALLALAEDTNAKG